MVQLRRVQLGFDWSQLNCSNDNRRAKKFVIRALNEGDCDNQDKTIKSVKDKVFVNTRNAVVWLRESVSSVPPFFMVKFLSFVGVNYCYTNFSLNLVFYMCHCIIR